jgi:hypothetical protein
MSDDENDHFRTAKELRENCYTCDECGADYRSPAPAECCCTSAARTEGGSE